MHLYVVQN